MDDTPTIARACMLLAVLVNEIRGLRADLTGRARRRVVRALSDADREILAVLLPAVNSVLNDREFTAGALVRHKRLKGAVTGQNALLLGHVLKRAAAAEEPVAGLYVHFLRRNRMGAVFCVDTNDADHRAAFGFAKKMRENLPI